MIKQTAIFLLTLALSGCGDSGQAQSLPPVATVNPEPASPSVPVVAANINFEPSPTSGITADPQIGDAYFMESGGRPGHEGLFKVQMRPLPAGAQYVLMANIVGDIATASYKLTSLTGTVLATEQLTSTALRYQYAANVTVPSQAFFLEIIASAKNGKSVTSKVPLPYETLGLTTKITPDTALLKPGQAVGVTIDIISANVSGQYEVKLNLPAGFVSDAGPWVTTLSPNSKSTFRANVTAPTGQPELSAFTLRAVAQAQGGLQEKQYAQVRVLVN